MKIPTVEYRAFCTPVFTSTMGSKGCYLSKCKLNHGLNLLPEKNKELPASVHQLSEVIGILWNTFFPPDKYVYVLQPVAFQTLLFVPIIFSFLYSKNKNSNNNKNNNKKKRHSSYSSKGLFLTKYAKFKDVKMQWQILHNW